MEILPSIKPQNSRIVLTYSPYFTHDSKRDSISWNNFHQIKCRRLVFNRSWNETGSVIHRGPEDMPLSIALEPILSESEFDRVLADAQQLREPVVVLWMASWCRKCIYLKPKLEKLAADYHPRIRFYSIDVNNVPHKLVLRAGVTKMPTIQIWRDGKKQAEAIGAHQAYLVVNEVRELIENENSSI